MAKRQRRRRQGRRKDHARRQGWTTRHSVITGAGLVAGAIGVGPAAAQGAVLYVGSTGDTGGANSNCLNSTNNDCTLRQALYGANSNADFDYVYFESGLSGTITLGSYLSVTNPVGIYGPNFDNPSQLTISGDDNNGIFDVNVVTPGDFVGIASLRLTHGSQPLGGAVYNYDSELSIFNSVLTGNEAYAGGAVYEYGGYEGGVNTRITYSTLSDNTASVGGAMSSKYGFGLIGSSTLSGNDAYAGGAIYAGRNTDSGGGAIFDTTISGNTATYTSGVVTDYVYPFYNSILADEGGGNYPDFFASQAFVAYASLIKDQGASPLDGEYNIVGTDPALGALGDNGGPTPTMRPNLKSPVIDAGYGEGGYDQRFAPRIIDVPDIPNRLGAFDPTQSAVDIGAVELSISEATAPSSPQAPPPPVTGTKKKCKKKHKKKHHAAQSAKKKKCKRKKKKRSAVAMARHASHRWDHAGQRLGDGSHLPSWADTAWKTGR